MIGRLRGKIVESSSDSVILEVAGGIGYRIYCHQRLISSLSPAEEVIIYIETHVREDHIHLYGFSSESEKEWFLTLQKVKGVGARLALTILGSITLSNLQNAILTQDQSCFKLVSGVGPKLAERIILELKTNNLPAPPALQQQSTGGYLDKISLINDAVAALGNLGYSKTAAYNIVSNLVSSSPQIELSNLIRLALQELASSK